MRYYFKIFAVIAVVGGLVACNKDKEPDNLVDFSGGCEAVDLGLSVKWATYNVGASAPEEYGSYFAWGETQEKDFYGWSKDGYYKWGTKFKMTKYTCNDEGGDGFDTLLPEDDAATVNWGPRWRTPTVDEIKELLDETKCKWTWDDQKKGYTVTGLKTGNSIFLPAAGYRTSSLSYPGIWGHYWSSSLSDVNSGYLLDFNSTGHGCADDYRFAGQTVRAVTEY